MSVNNNELLPCPFCGGEARFARGFDYGADGVIRWVYCNKCGAMTRSDLHKTKADAAKAWNTRWSYYGDTIECYECAIGGKEAAQRSVEENIRAQGYVKERTCRNIADEWHEKYYGKYSNLAGTAFVCSECGARFCDCEDYYAYMGVPEKPDSWKYHEQEPVHYCPNCGARVMSEEEEGHKVADAIRRLEKAVKG